MKILFAAGGTAGHINPALAIAEYLVEKDKSTLCAFVGNKTGMENELVSRKGYPFFPIEMQGLRRSLSPKNLKTLYLTLRAPRAAKGILEAFRPDLVLGTGGFLSYPVLKAAHRLGIPTVLHESNAVPGLAVKLSEPYTDRILLYMPSAKDRLRHPEKARVTGMPLFASARETWENARKKLGIPKNAFLLLSFGGSLGAAAINRAVLALFRNPELQKDPDFYLLHSTGRRYYAAFSEELKQERLPRRMVARPYLYDIPLFLAAADLAVTRAGASTLAEIAESQTPSILIPSPHVTGNHQYQNAVSFEKAGAALMIEERNLAATTLLSHVIQLRKNPKRCQSMQEQLRQFENRNALRQIREEIYTLLEEKV